MQKYCVCAKHNIIKEMQCIKDIHSMKCVKCSVLDLDAMCETVRLGLDAGTGQGVPEEWSD